MKVSATEHGVLRVFRIELSDAEIDDFKTEVFSDDDTALWPLKDALGAGSLDHDFIEVFPVSNLGDYGMVKYLTDANGIPADQVEPLRMQLEGLSGHVLLVFSAAFGGAAQTLNPKSPLRHIATFTEEPLDMTAVPLDSDAALPYSGGARNAPETGPNARGGSALVLITFGILAFFILWFVAGP